MRPELKLRQPTVDRFALAGGLELDSPPSSRKPGVVHDGVNFEPLPSGGYGRFPGYFRWSGGQRVQEAIDGRYQVFEGTKNTGSGGAPVVGMTSGATAFMVVEYPTTAAGVSRYILVQVVGSFTAGEYVAFAQAPTTPITTILRFPTPTVLEDSQYRETVSSVLRAQIASPGGGPANATMPMLGGFTYEGQVYAVRAMGDGTTAFLARSDSTLGWSTVSNPNGPNCEVFFTSFVGSPAALTGAFMEVPTASGGRMPAQVLRVLVESGTGVSGDPYKGRVITRFGVDANADGMVMGTTLPGPAGQITLKGRITPIVLPHSDAYEITVGVVGVDPCVYIATGKSTAFQFDGELLIPIHTGAEVDQPTHVAVFQNHLFLAQGNSVQNSSLGEPFVWSAVTGAAEFRAGGNVTGLIVMPGNDSAGALGVTTSASHSVLYGTSSADFKLVALAQGAGARARTLATLGLNTLALSSSGITTLAASQNYGNFASASLTANLNSWLQPRIGKVVGCCVSAAKSQYLLFFSTGEALVLGLVNGKFIGALPLKFPAGDVPTCAWGGQDDNGVLQPMFVGMGDGRVVQLGVGRTYDGNPVEGYFELNFNAGRMAGVRRTLKRLIVEGSASGNASFTVTARVDQGSAGVAQPAGESTGMTETVTDTVVWSGTGAAGEAPIRVDGTGESVAVRVSSTGISDPFAITSIAIHHLPRRLAR